MHPNIYLLKHQVLALQRACWCLFFLSILSCAGFSQSISQSLISNAGDYVENPSIGSLHWSVGEIAVEQLENTSILSQGFHQTYFDLLSTAIWEHPDLVLDMSVYPNPTVGWINLETTYEKPLQIVVSNVLGQTMMPIQEFSLNTQLDLSRLPSGMYLLTVLEEGQLVKTFKIQKQS